MYLLKFSLDNLSLMALTLSVGFVVDDAVVMLENIVRRIESGDTVMEAALNGSREIGFTIVSMTVSLVAVFIPVLSWVEFSAACSANLPSRSASQFWSQGSCR